MRPPGKAVSIPTRLELVRELYRSRIGNAVKGLIGLLVFGTAGYWILGECHRVGLIEPVIKHGSHWRLIDCLYFTTITLTTVGYGETLGPDQNLANFPDVRAFTILLLLFGMIATAYFLSSATAFFVEGDLKRVLERRRMLNKIAALRGHFIVCGAGLTGRHVAEEIAASKKDVVVIDGDPKNLAILHEHTTCHSIVGDATKDETLIEAGIHRAGGLASCLTDDKDNLFLTITARQLSPQLRIISKAIDMPTGAKLRKAGADGVVAPTFIGGMRMASELVRPAVVNFLDQMLRNKEAPVRFAEVRVGSALVGRTLGEVDIPRRCGLPVLALKRPAQEAFDYNPGPETHLVEGMVLVVMGEVARVVKLEELVGGNRSSWIGAGVAQGTTAISAEAARVLRQEAGATPSPAQPVATPEPRGPEKVLVQELKDPRDPI
jgi:voltage-gated potassium channel